MTKRGMLVSCLLGALLALMLAVPGFAEPEFVTLESMGESRESAVPLYEGTLYYIDTDVVFKDYYSSGGWLHGYNSWLKLTPQKSGGYTFRYYTPSGWVDFDIETQYGENILHGDAGALNDDSWKGTTVMLEKGEVYYIDFHFDGVVHFAICGPDNHAGEGTKEIKEATCTEAGTESIICEYCRATFSQKTIPATGHMPGAMTVLQEATCTQEGTQVKTCLNCGEVLESVSIPLTEHAPSEMIDVISPSCLQAGRREQFCLMCGLTLNSEELPALGHEYTEWETLYEPTKESEGERQRHCIRCGDTQQEKIPKLSKFLGLF